MTIEIVQIDLNPGGVTGGLACGEKNVSVARQASGPA